MCNKKRISKDNWIDATIPLNVIRESALKPTMQDMEKFIEDILSIDADQYNISISVDEIFVN